MNINVHMPRPYNARLFPRSSSISIRSKKNILSLISPLFFSSIAQEKKKQNLSIFATYRVVNIQNNNSWVFFRSVIFQHFNCRSIRVSSQWRAEVKLDTIFHFQQKLKAKTQLHLGWNFHAVLCKSQIDIVLADINFIFFIAYPKLLLLLLSFLLQSLVT